MATNSVILNGEIAARQARTSFEHRFFLAVAILFPVVIIIGFAPSYYFKPLFNSPPLPSGLVHAHGLTMTAWMGLFLTQAYLITSKRIRLHMTLGMAGVGLAIVMMVLGVMTGIEAAARGGTVPGFTPEQFLIVPIGDMVVFGILFAGAIYYRKQAASHKRLMLLTVLNFLAPSLGRMSIGANFGPLWFWGVPYLTALVLLGLDSYRNGKINRPFLIGTILMIASGPLRLMFAQTPPWNQFATWLIG